MACAQHPANVLPLRERRHAAQSISARRRGAVYNTVDAALWYFEAVRQYFEATSDIGLLNELFPVLDGIIDAHVRGTRYHIHVDPADGLLYAGEPGVQLTWMDAKVGDRVVTPRIGKPVEVNALWLNAAASMARFAQALGRNAARYEDLAKRARTGFARFWNSEKQFCFDVIDAPGCPDGKDATLRPNQISAVSLPETASLRNNSAPWWMFARASCSLRSGFAASRRRRQDTEGTTAGGPEERDAAYHQGTVWGWLLGPFALAHLRVYQNADAGDVISGADVSTHHGRRAWHGQRDF